MSGKTGWASYSGRSSSATAWRWPSLVVFFRPELLVGHARRCGRSRPPSGSRAPLAAPLAKVASPEAADTSQQRRGRHRPGYVFADAVHRAAPAVVNIYTARALLVVEQVGGATFEADAGGRGPGPRFQQRVQRALGSGVIVDESGHVITNNHVIANATTVGVKLADGRSGCRQGGQAAIRTPTWRCSRGRAGEAHGDEAVGGPIRLQVGDEVLAIGNPLGLRRQTRTGSSAPSTASSWAWPPMKSISSRPTRPSTRAIPAEPLINAASNWWRWSARLITEEYGDAHRRGGDWLLPSPSTWRVGVMRDIIAHGHVVRGWSGLITEDFSDELAAQYGLAHKAAW